MTVILTAGSFETAGAAATERSRAQAAEALLTPSRVVTGLLVPMYIYPANIYTNADYNNLIALARKYQRVPVTAILNPSSGPGSVVDGNFSVAIKRMAGARISILGYVSTLYNGRTLAAVKADIDTWLTLYPGIEGIFLDEMTNTDVAANYTFYKALTDYVHSKGLKRCVANPGAGVPNGYFDVVDQVVVYESGSYPSEATLKGDFGGGYSDVAYEKRAAFVYNVALDAATVSTMKQYVGDLYVTNDTTPNPYDTLPSYLDLLLSALSPGAALSQTTPLVDSGSGSAGTSTAASHGDHVHPTDTSRAALASPVFTGTPSLPTGTTAVTQAAGDATLAVATTAFVSSTASTFTATIGDGTATTIDVTHNLNTRALLVSTTQTASPYAEVYPHVEYPSLNVARFIFSTAPPTGAYLVAINGRTFGSGAVTAHSASHSPGGSDPLNYTAVGGQLASSATPSMAGVAAAGTATTLSRGDHVHPTDTTRAATASPTFTGTPAAPTAAAGTSTTQVATTAFVTASPVFTGTPTAPTATPGTATTQLATTAFAAAAISGAGPSVARSVLATGITNQTRAGRQLAVADFTAMGLSTPVGLFNLGSTANLGSGGALVNKGAVTFASGVTGTASEAAQFTGSTAQALYIADTGAADPFRIATGSLGCWFRTAKRGTAGYLVTKADGAFTTMAYFLSVATAVSIQVSLTGTTTVSLTGATDVADDRWHFAVATHDGSTVRLFVDGVLDGSLAVAGTLFPGAAAFNIGGYGADGATAAAQPHFGRIDEAFVTPDVLSLDQIRNLYAVRVPHTLAVTPKSASATVDRYRRGAVLASGDFPTQPVRLHNFTNGSGADIGSGAQGLTFNAGTGTLAAVGGPDGLSAGAAYMSGAHNGFSATDTGLPSGTSSRSYGLWLKTSSTAATTNIIVWGTVGGAEVRLYIDAGRFTSFSGADGITPPLTYNDGQWHQVVITEESAPVDGVKRKFYVDGALVATSLVLNSVTLAGANAFRVGANQTGGFPTTGTFARAFVANYVLTPEQIISLYAKGSQQLISSPKNAGDQIEGIDATNVYVIGDQLEPQDRINVGVTAQ